ncbi:stage II sporulation protein [Virgibacillus profundi]|uniref:Stage II sporulation protein n=1 Tax=Virgibacillus profundi TaxID=2024555 RepID=A0A2A2IJK8_9BACI|nr:M23 family metallopeptidase [Virgibacillus profundi]PAV31340.1 stage II sporulation protein [Virgibacillus profundi]PXY55526.1 M23 family peptidase [Virgibacillus profundi]
MNEENKGGSKNKWTRIFRKKWFFPAVYLTIAALLLAVVVWYQNLDNQIPEADNDSEQLENTGDYIPTPNDEDAEPVVEQQEVILMPVTDQDQAEIVTKFYDYDAEQEDKENALVLHNNRYYQSTGVDIAAADGETFDVVSALSGTVTEVKEDPLLGNVVIMSHENDVKTYYASLGEVLVKTGAEVMQGEQIGTAGNNIFGKDSGTHVYFQLDKDGKEVNPEEFFNQSVSTLDSVTDEQAEEESEASEESGTVEEDSEASEESGTVEESDEQENEEDNSVDESDESEESDGEEENPEDETSDSSETDESA